MSIKSTTCFSRNGKPLTEYYNEMEALENAAFIKSQFGREMTAYRCEKCGMWHLAPADRQTPSRRCKFCKDSKGGPKELYFKKIDAERRAKILFEEKGIKLKVYECPTGEGFHLTKY